MADKEKDIEKKDEQSPEEEDAQTESTKTAEADAQQDETPEETDAQAQPAEQAADDSTAAEDGSLKEASDAEEAAEESSAPKAQRSSPPVTGDESAGELEGVAAFFDHPKHLLAATAHARDAQYKDFDALSPFPITGMEDALGVGRSWIPWVTFSAGVVGFLAANALQFGMMTFDWPIIIGGKPFAPVPSFVPVMFELTVLVAGVTTVFTMLKAAGCFKKPLIIDPRITDDRFVLWISANDKNFELNEAIAFMETLNPLEIRKIVKDS